MVNEATIIKNPSGLHLRPAGILCKEALKFKSKISFRVRNVTANAKSVLSVLGACVKCGEEVEFICDGSDEEEALKAHYPSGGRPSGRMMTATKGCEYK